MDGIYTMASPSSSSLYGNVGCAIRQLILSKFPYNYFKYMNVSTEVAFHNLRRQFGSNTNIEISKRKYPQLIVQPVYQVPDQDSFLQNVPLTKNDMDIQSNIDRRYLFEVIKDTEYDWALKFKLNRDRIDYDVSVITHTLHQQLDIYKAMVNQMTWDRSFYYPAALEAVIPKTMIEYMSRLCHMDIFTYPEFIPMFLRHLNSISGYPITYKVRNASATDEFFMYYKHNLVVTFTDLSIETANKKNMLDESYTITFRVSVDFNLPGMFILDGAESNMAMLKGILIDKNSTGKDYTDQDEFIPLFSLSDFYNRFPQRKDGLTLYGSFVFTSESKDDKDSADIGLLIEPDHQKAIRFHTKCGMLDDTICKVYVMKDSEMLPEDQYKVNWDTMKIEYLHPDKNATYRVAIYMNMELINAALANARIDNPYDQHMLRENQIDYSKAMNETNINLDNPHYNDTDFAATSEGRFEDKPIPGIFRGEGLDPNRVVRNQENMVAMPTTREHEDAWHRMAVIPKDNQFENNMEEVPSDHRDENSFHLMAQENKDTSIYPDMRIVPSDHRDENSFHLMAQENKDTSIYPEINPTYSDRQDHDSMHRMSTTPGRDFTSSDVHTQVKADGTINYIGEIDLGNLISAFEEETPEQIKEDEKQNDPPKEEEIPETKPEPEEEKKEVIMKYYSSIFDNSSSMIAEKDETPTKKYKWVSSTDNQEVEEKLHFKDSLDPVHIDAINTWSKIISNAMLYNFATKIAIEDNNNYEMDIDGKLIPEKQKPATNHLCECGCDDESECTCGWKDKIDK